MRSRALSSYNLVVASLVVLVVGGLLVPYVRVAATRTSTEEVAGSATGATSVTGAGEPGSVAAGPGGATATGPGVVAGSAAGAGGAGSVAGSAPGASAAAAASGPGVTDSEIHLGIGVLDIGAAKDLGFNFDLGDQQARFSALIADQNAKGGINGRKIVPHFRVVNATDESSKQAACVAWTQDEHVFTVFVTTQFSPAAQVCVIGQGATPLFTADGIERSYYANGLLYSSQPSDNRILADQAAYLIEKGSLVGKKIGVLSGDGADRLAVDQALVPALAAGGFSVADVEVIPADISGTQKTSIAISNLKAAGVDFVIIAANVILAGPFVQSADRAGYRPAYALSDFNNQINDQVAGYYPASFEGTIGLSNHDFAEYRAGNPTPAADQACLDRVQAADPKVLPTTNSAFEVAMEECGIWDAWVKGATNAGPVLNPATLRAGMEAIGPTTFAGVYDGSFGPGKHDGVDAVRELAWHHSCGCWELAGDIRAMR